MLRLNAIILAIAALFLVTACTYDADVSTEIDEIVQIDLGDLSGACSGTEVVQLPNATSTVTKTLVNSANGPICRFDITYAGTLVDMNTVKSKIETEIRNNDLDPADVSTKINGIDLTIEDITFSDRNDTQVAPPTLPFLDLSLSVAGDEILGFSGNDVTPPFGAPLVVSLPQSAVALADKTLKNASPLPLDGSIQMDMLDSDRIRLANQLSNGGTIRIQLKAAIQATGTVGVLDAL